MNRLKRWAFILAAVLVLASNTVSAQKPDDGRMAKLHQSLVALHEQYNVRMAESRATRFSSADPLIRLVDDRVVIDAVASGDVGTLKSDLAALGMQHAVSVGRTISGQLPISSLPAAAALTSLKFAHSAAAMTHAGNVTSQGDMAMRSDTARMTFGVDGTGVSVGVLSDSFGCITTGPAADVASGDLSPVVVLQDDPGCSSGTDEGRAMLQIVHDIAPGAGLLFATAEGGMANFAANITALKNNGAKVIVDDVIYLAEPMFQDGIIAQAVNNAVASGVAYFSAAGNNGRNSYSGTFQPGAVFAPNAFPSTPGAPPFSGGTAHDFDPGGGTDIFQRITLGSGQGFIMSFQWDSPAFSVSGGQGSPNDLNVYVFDDTGTQVVGGSNFNNVNGDPVELFSFTNNTGATADFNIMIVNFSGPNPGLIKYVLFGFNGTIQEFATSSGTIYGHANAQNAVAVGAARYSKTPAFGVSPPVLETFSSAGTTPILFDPAGNRLGIPDARSDKPEIVAPDGVDTTFFGSDTDGDGFPNFFGTSAAAPHAAAVAALLLHAKPSLSPSDVYGALEDTAIDMGTTGFDNDNGFGLLQADAAVSAVLTPPLTLNVSADKASPQPAGTTINFTATTTGGLTPIQFKWWMFNGVAWSVAKDWSTSNTFSWTPWEAGTYRIGVWGRSNGKTVDAPDRNAFAGVDVSISSLGLKIINLTADNVSPQQAGTPINFTATTSGGLAPIQFKWWVFNGTMWSVAKDWSTSNTLNWMPFVGGNYRIGVWAKSNGNPVDAPENSAFAGIDFSVTPPPDLSIANPAADKASPQPAGTTINFTATSSGGLAPIQFKWWVFNGAAWVVAKDWSADSTFNWMPFLGGNYRIGVWARSNGNTVDAPENNAFAGIDFSITPPSPDAALKVSGLTPDKTSPQPAGTTINFTVTTTGGLAPIQFKWWLFNGTSWLAIKDWSTSNTFTWMPTTAGCYRTGVWARSNGNPVDAPEGNAFAGFDFCITPPPPLSVTITADKASPQQAGATINFTAATTGGVTPIQFKWWLFNGTSWSVVKDWSTSNTFIWTPFGGNYRIGVWARSNGNTADAPENNAFTGIDFSITGPVFTSLTADKMSPQPAGTMINFTATTTGGVAPIEFKWWLFNGTTWAVVKDWSTSNTFAWTPFGGNYRIGVWARSNGNPVDTPETNAYAGSDFSIIGPSITNLSADKLSPQLPGTTINFTAAASGGIAPIQFKWWLFNGTTWSAVKDWSTSGSYSWTPTVGGSYTIGLWARSSGNPVDAPENNAFAGINFSITVPAAQVRAFNNLCLNPGCISFTGKLTASEGYTWFATSGNYSPYQTVTSPTLSNFTAEAVGYGLVLNLPGSFNIVQGRRYAMVVTVDSAGNPLLFQVDEGAVVSAPSQELLTSSKPIIGVRNDHSAVSFALSQSWSGPP